MDFLPLAYHPPPTIGFLFLAIIPQGQFRIIFWLTLYPKSTQNQNILARWPLPSCITTGIFLLVYIPRTSLLGISYVLLLSYYSGPTAVWHRGGRRLFGAFFFQSHLFPFFEIPQEQNRTRRETSIKQRHYNALFCPSSYEYYTSRRASGRARMRSRVARLTHATFGLTEDKS